MRRGRPRNRYRLGEHLITTCDGDVIYASDAVMETIGPRKGCLVHRDDLDQPGRFELTQDIRAEQNVRPRTGPPKQTWRVYDETGAVVPGGPADS